VVTNIDPEHLDHYGSFDRVKDAFVEFVENVPFYGAALLCLDHPEVQGILPRVRDRRIVTYGFSTQADVRGVNVQPIPGGNRFETIVRQRDGTTRSIEGIELPMPGRHNVQNALAAIGVALELGIDDATIQQGFAKFHGVKRRFTKVGETGGVTVIDDYGHHPVEIRAVLAAAREGVENRVIAVVQPHRFSRLGNLMEEFQGAFNDADMVYVTPVYAAGEAPVEGVDADALVEGLKRRGHRSAATIADADALATTLAVVVQPGDMVVCLGAGDITKWAAGLAPAIEALR
jgi:UDP-N-acetylmuramate--alanine ligase